MVIGPAGRAMRAGDCHWIAGWLAGRFGVDVPVPFVEKWHRKVLYRRRLSWDWSDGSWAMWWKNRLDEAGALLVPFCPPGASYHPTAVLHTGFLSLLETEEELAILARDTAGFEPRRGEPDTPAIERTPWAVINPIDRTAARVVK